MVYAVLGLYSPSRSWHRCPEIGTSSIDWAQMSSGVFREIKRTVFQIKTGRWIMPKSIIFVFISPFQIHVYRLNS
jgi:hypothetical protein